MNRKGSLFIISLILVCFIIPNAQAQNNGIVIAGVKLPDDATLFYDENGNLVGAKVDHPGNSEVMEPQNPFDARNHLSKVAYRRSGSGIDIDFVDDGKTVSTRHLNYEDIMSYLSSPQKVEVLLQQIDNSENQPIASSFATDSPVVTPYDTPGPIGPLGYWRLSQTQIIDHEYTKIAEIYSTTYLENQLTLKVHSGTKTSMSINGGPIAYGYEIVMAETSITDFYVTAGASRAIEYMFDYKYEYWEWCTLWGVPLGETREYWYPTLFRSLSGRLGDWISSYKTKTTSDDTLTLNPYAHKHKVYSALASTTFGYDFGVRLTGSWGSFGASVPMFSYSHLTNHYTQYEAVYTFYNPTSQYHEWEVYEWESNVGTSDGWVLSFKASGGGGGCPILSVYNGEDYVEEGLLDIHNPDGFDVSTERILSTRPERVNGRYLLRLTEHPQTISHIDQVKLFVRLGDGAIIQLQLLSAVHSADGQVKQELLRSDDTRVDVFGAEHNNGKSEFINLEFVAPLGLDIIDYIFIIEGNNAIIKR